MTVLGLIPAKGTSERLPRKNLAELGGQPLLAWTIEAAKASGLFGDHLWVSSEDGGILAVARQYGAEALRRPSALAQPEVTVADVVQHARQALEWRGPVYVLLPSTPFRDVRTILLAWDRFRATHAHTLLSVVPNEHPPEWAMWMLGDRIEPLSPCFSVPRSDLRPTYRHDGGHWITHPSGTGSLAVPVRPEEAVDINTPLDLAFAEFLLATGRVPWARTFSS